MTEQLHPPGAPVRGRVDSAGRLVSADPALEALNARGAGDIVVFGGGIIPDEDIPVLEELGVAKVFTPGATTAEITDWVAQAFAEPA